MRIFRFFPLFFPLFMSAPGLSPAFAEEKEGAYEEGDLEDAPSFEDKVKKVKVKRLSDLRRLSPFEDIAVIQKRFLPKTGRGEAGLSFLGVLNKQFFWSAGAGGHISFFIQEKHGIGLQGYGAYQWEKPVAVGMHNNQKITPFDYITPRFFAAAYYKWTPVYGKFSFLNKKIHYFDLYFNVGGGAYYVVSAAPPDSGVSPLSQPWAPALLLAGGQVFALTRSLGVFWEIAGRFYPSPLLQAPRWRLDLWETNISFSFGVNAYFPKAGQRG